MPRVAETIKDKSHWIMVPDGPLAGLPFQMLLASTPTAQTTMKTAHWLIRDHAVSVLPAVSSPRALRKVAAGKTRTASLPFIGFGDPQIGGDTKPVSCTAFERRTRDGTSIEMASVAPIEAVGVFSELRL